MGALAYYDDVRQAWVADAGDFDLLRRPALHGPGAPHP
jgi:hypothetical protein